MDLLLAMRDFSRVVERGNISEAARDLGISQSTLSGRITRLEEHLGGSLLFRNTRSVSLTDIGRQFYVRSKRTLELAAVADETPASFAFRRLRGHLRIVAPYFIGDLMLPRILERFHRMNPEVSFEIILNDRVVDPAVEGGDISICMGKVSCGGFAALDLGLVKQVLVASPSYIVSRGAPQRPEELLRHAFVRVIGRFEDGVLPLRAHSKAIEAPIHTVWAVGNWRPLYTLLLGGEGIGVAKLPIVSVALANGKLRVLLPDYELPSVPISLLYPNRTVAPEMNMKAIAFISQELRQLRDGFAAIH